MRSSSQGRPLQASRPWRSRLAQGARRRGGQRRFDAGLWRPARPHGASDPCRGGRGAARLYGHVDAAVNYSVGRYVGRCRRSPRGPARRSQLPIFVGGTGLYFKALTEGLSDMPPVPDAVREAVRPGERGPARRADLHRLLAARDPATAATPCARRTGCGCSAPWRSSPRPGGRSRPSTGRGSRGRWPACRSSSSSWRRTATCCDGGSTPASSHDGAGALDEVRALMRRAARPDAAGHARPRGAGPARPSARGDRASTRRSPGARRIPAAMPSASSPGFATRCRTGPGWRPRRRSTPRWLPSMARSPRATSGRR